MNSSEFKANLAQSYELFESTIPKVMASPSPSILEKFTK